MTSTITAGLQLEIKLKHKKGNKKVGPKDDRTTLLSAARPASPRGSSCASATVATSQTLTTPPGTLVTKAGRTAALRNACRKTALLPSLATVPPAAKTDTTSAKGGGGGGGAWRGPWWCVRGGGGPRRCMEGGGHGYRCPESPRHTSLPISTNF